jgi:hypothetical protein
VLLLGLDLIPRRKRVGVRTLGGIVLNGILLAVPRIGVSFNSRSRDAGLPLGPLSTRSSHRHGGHLWVRGADHPFSLVRTGCFGDIRAGHTPRLFHVIYAGPLGGGTFG